MHFAVLDGGRSLKVEEAHASHSGTYSCVATNLAGRANAEIILDVLLSPYFEEISYKQEEVALAGTKVRFDCNVSGNPEPRVSRLSVSVGHSQGWPCCTKEIEVIINFLKMKNSRGYDEISTKIFKISTLYILSPLAYICNKVLSTGVFPDTLKYLEIKPLLKKGDKTRISNYRPISLLISFSKIIENIIYKGLCDHININNILVKEQFGLRTNSSTEIAAYILINNILSSLNNKLMVGGLFCDLQ